jgi:hypothetical protein
MEKRNRVNSDNSPDEGVIRQIEERLKNATRELHQLAPLLGQAEQVIEFAADQRKNILAAEQVRFIKNGESAASSEVMARECIVYLDKLKMLENNVQDAHRVKAKWRATMCSFEAARSLLARQRETLRTLEG